MEGRRLLLAIIVSIAVTVTVTGSTVTDTQERRTEESATWSTAAHVRKLAESSLVATPADFYCVLVMKMLEELECYFEAWPGTHWNLSYFTKAKSGSVEFSCVTQHCGVNLTGPALRITTYYFTLRNFSAQPTNASAAISRHSVYSDVYITRLSTPENVQLARGRTHLLVTWTPPLSVYGVLEFQLEDLATSFGLEHEISYREAESRANHSEIIRLSSRNMSISANLTYLKPFCAYEIRIRSRVNGSTSEHTWSPAKTASVTTLEAAPTVAPEALRDGFNLMKCNESQCIANIYWKDIEETSGKSNGKLSGYLVTIDTDAQKFKVRAMRPPLVTTLNMSYSSQLFIQGETSDGTGPPSDIIRIPSLANVIRVDPCALHASEMNVTTVKLTWSLRQQSEREDVAVLHIHWCYIVKSECSDVSTAPENFSAVGEALITVDKPPVSRYRFGVSAAGSRERSSGLVWRDLLEPSFACTETMPTQSLSELTEGAITGIVLGVTVAIIFVALVSWRLKKEGKIIRRIPHIPKTQQATEAPLKRDSYKYDTVLNVREFPTLVNSGCGLKVASYVVHAHIDRDVQQSTFIMEPSQDFPIEANLSANRDMESGNCLKVRKNESTAQDGYTVLFEDLISQARLRQSERQSAIDAILQQGFDFCDDRADGSASSFVDSWCPSVFADDRHDQPLDSKECGERKFCSSPPTSSDYVTAIGGEQQS